MDLREYRPKGHRAFVHWVAESAKHRHVKAKALHRSSTALPLLQNLDIVRQIRAQHWNMTKAYIISNTKHPKATGGTPITTWLPNQLGGTLEYMEECCTEIHALRAKGDKLSDADHTHFLELEASVKKHIGELRKEVLGLQDKFQDQEVAEFQKRAH
jgi:indoleamine 2,3-dioxygenase